MNQTEATDISSSPTFNFRQWRAAWKQPASVTASLAPALYGLVGSNWLPSTTPGVCWSIATTTPCECWASPTRPPERQSWRVPVATARTSAPLTWFTWKSPPASAGPRATPQVRAAALVPKTPAARACAADGVTTPPCTSPACPATARCAGAAMWSVRHVWERRRCIPARAHDKWCDVTEKCRQNKRKDRLAQTLTEVSAQDLTAGASLCRTPRMFVVRNMHTWLLYYGRLSAIAKLIWNSLKLFCLSPLKCTEIPLFWDKRKQASVTGTGQDWNGSQQQYKVKLLICRGALILTLVYYNCFESFHLTIYSLYL